MTRLTHRTRLAAMLAGALTLCGSACASGLDQLHQFLEKTRTAQGSFTQKVTNQARRTTQSTGGTFAFARPGRFRWTYDKPFDQVIVGDGSRVWVYDRDLNQVIVRKLDLALGATPAALLAGDNELEKNFTLVAGPSQDGLEYVDATPKTGDAQFTHVRLGFRDAMPQSMELQDAFGQTTVLNFSKMERNPALAQDLFRFVPPAGADVVGDTAPKK